MKLPKALREFAVNHQHGRCLVCPFPVALGMHLHHVIARDDGGPDHPLNLIALCPNHHLVLELIRRHIAPRETQGRAGWDKRAGAAAQFIASLSGPNRILFDQLSEPHPLRQPISEGVAPPYRIALAHDIAVADTAVLLRANLARPSALLIWRITQRRHPSPATDVESSAAASEMAESACGRDVAEAVERHLRQLDLPYDAAWAQDLTVRDRRAAG